MVLLVCLLLLFPLSLIHLIKFRVGIKVSKFWYISWKLAADTAETLLTPPCLSLHGHKKAAIFPCSCDYKLQEDSSHVAQHGTCPARFGFVGILQAAALTKALVPKLLVLCLCSSSYISGELLLILKQGKNPVQICLICCYYCWQTKTLAYLQKHSSPQNRDVSKSLCSFRRYSERSHSKLEKWANMFHHCKMFKFLYWETQGD